MQIMSATSLRLCIVSVIAVWMTIASSTFAQEFKFLEVTVHDENGQPMAEVTVDINMDGLEFPMPTDADGVISLNVATNSSPVVLKAHHPGYESKRIRWEWGKDVPKSHTLELQLGKPTSGVVLDADGQPVAEAELYAAPPDEPLTFVNGRNPTPDKQVPVGTDEQGHFTLPFQPQGTTIACLSDAGWAQFVVADESKEEPLEVQLTPWARLELVSKLGGEIVPGEIVGAHYVKALEKDRGNTEWLYRGTTDQHGQEVFSRAIPGTAMAYREVAFQPAPGQRMVENRSHGVIVTLVSGLPASVQFGGKGNLVTGRFVVPVDYDGEVDWSTGYVALTENNHVDLLMRTMIFEYGKLLSQGSVMDPRERVPPSLRPNYLVRYLAPLDDDGAIALAGVPAGNYQLSASVTAQQAGRRDVTDVLTLSDVPITITYQEGKKRFNLGEPILDHSESINLGE